MAKKAKGNRVQVILECTEHKNSGMPGTSRYVTTKNRKNTPERLELMKYNPILKKMTLHKEIKYARLQVHKQFYQLNRLWQRKRSLPSTKVTWMVAHIQRLSRWLRALRLVLTFSMRRWYLMRLLRISSRTNRLVLNISGGCISQEVQPFFVLFVALERKSRLEIWCSR